MRAARQRRNINLREQSAALPHFCDDNRPARSAELISPSNVSRATCRYLIRGKIRARLPIPSKCACRISEGGSEGKEREQQHVCGRARGTRKPTWASNKSAGTLSSRAGREPFCTLPSPPPPAFTDGRRRPFPRAASPSGRRGRLQTASLAPLPSSSRTLSFLSPRRGAIVLTSIFYISSQPLNALNADTCAVPD